jgi:hypothetical protein
MNASIGGGERGFEVNEYWLCNFAVNRSVNRSFHCSRQCPGVVEHDVVPGQRVDRGVGPSGETVCMCTKPDEVRGKTAGKLCAAIMGGEECSQCLRASGHCRGGSDEHALFDFSSSAIAAKELQHLLVSFVFKGLMPSFASHPTQDPHSCRMKGRDRRMVLAQPGIRTEVQPGEQKSAGEAHSEASVEAWICEDAMSKLSVCFHHSVRACFAVLQR